MLHRSERKIERRTLPSARLKLYLPRLWIILLCTLLYQKRIARFGRIRERPNINRFEWESPDLRENMTRYENLADKHVLLHSCEHYFSLSLSLSLPLSLHVLKISPGDCRSAKIHCVRLSISHKNISSRSVDGHCWQSSPLLLPAQNSCAALCEIDEPRKKHFISRQDSSSRDSRDRIMQRYRSCGDFGDTSQRSPG